MIVLCPGCKARYNVDENKIGEQGLKLKCPKCSTAFKVNKPAGAAKPAAPAAPRPAPPAPAPAPKPAAAPPPPARPPAAAPSPPRPAAPAPQAPPAPARPAPQPAPTQPPPAQPPAAKPTPAAPAAPPAKEAAPPAKQLAAGPYVPGGESKGTVLVADVDDAFLKKIARLMLQNSFTVYLAHDGAKAMELIKSKSPNVAIVDVGLPKIFGFEMVDMVNQDPALKDKTKMVLLGSVYEKDRFRRQPQSLYGASEYIEKHDDFQRILAKVKKLILGIPEPPEQRPAPAPAEARPPAAARTPAAEPPPVPDDPDHKKAARLARTIVSDISLYNTDLVDRGVKEGNLYDLLAKDIGDGLKHYNSRVSEEIRSQRDYFKEAMENLIRKKKQKLGLA